MNEGMNCRNAMEICNEIRIKRWEMMDFAQIHGMSHNHTIQISEELDKLINEYLILQHHTPREMRVETKGLVVILQEPFYNDYFL